MPQYNVYSQFGFPPGLKRQALAFMREQWPSLFTREPACAAETFVAALDPVHFVATERDLLVSYASIVPLNVEHAGKAYMAYALGNMFTFPSFRGHGCGTRVLRSATDFIHHCDVDIAILFCEPKHECFYARNGWEATRSPTRIGAPGRYEVHDLSRMMLFVSEKGRGGRKDFQERACYLKLPWSLPQ